MGREEFPIGVDLGRFLRRIPIGQETCVRRAACVVRAPLVLTEYATEKDAGPRVGKPVQNQAPPVWNVMYRQLLHV